MSELGSLLKKSTVILQDEGTTLGAVPVVNITGAGATASITGAVGTINIPGGGSSSVAIEDEGAPQGSVDTINFTGAGVTASVAANVATVNIPGGGAGASWTEIEFDFGSGNPQYDAQFTITDASIGPTSKVVVVTSGKVATGRVAGDGQWDSISYDALAGTGSATVYAMAHPGPVVGRRYAQYTVA